VQVARDHGRDVLPVAERVRRHEGGPAQRLKGLEHENVRLKRLLADAELDDAILREAAHS